MGKKERVGGRTGRRGQKGGRTGRRGWKGGDQGGRNPDVWKKESAESACATETVRSTTTKITLAFP